MKESYLLKANSFSVKKFPTLYGTQRLITVFSLPATGCETNKSTVSSHPIFKMKLILSSCLHLGLPSGHFPSGFLTKRYYLASIAPMHATCTTHFILFDLTILILLGKEDKLLSSSCVFLQPPASLSLPDPNMPHSILFSNSSVEGQGSLLLFYTTSVEEAD